MDGHKSLAREYLEALLIAIVFATFARTFVVQAFKIPSGSMEQNLLIGDHILVNKFIYGPTISPLETKLLPIRPVRRGDVVVFKFPQDPSRDFIKRCVGVPGDVVELVDKRLRLNGREVHDEGYVYHSDDRVFPRSPILSDGLRQRDNFGPVTVAAGHYFCMGDNRDNSNDSRFWGEVPVSHLKGRAFAVYWSFASDVEAEEPVSLSAKLRQLGTVALQFATHTRWNRAFRVVR